LSPTEAQVVVGKFAYGTMDKDLHDEEVDVFVRRGCGASWERLGSATTTTEGGHHPAVDGVEDRGGQVFFEIPPDRALPVGKHLVRLVVAGDLTVADATLLVLGPGTPVFVSDVDGTLTSSEYVEVFKTLEGTLPEAHPGAPEAFSALASKGYRPIYLTARPELLLARTRAFLQTRGFPPGLVRTSPRTFGAGVGVTAAEFKKSELAALAAIGLKPTFAFGNTPSDAAAYAHAGVEPARCFFYRLEGTYAGRRVDSYRDLLPELSALGPAR
jgi:phosphatidate phosphatase PAH1